MVECSASWILILCGSVGRKITSRRPRLGNPGNPLASEPLGLARYPFVGLRFQLSKLVSGARTLLTGIVHRCHI